MGRLEVNINSSIYKIPCLKEQCFAPIQQKKLVKIFSHMVVKMPFINVGDFLGFKIFWQILEGSFQGW